MKKEEVIEKRKCRFCDGEAQLQSDFPLCTKHALQFQSFSEKKQEMRVERNEDMRVLERMAKLNPGLVKCPGCGGTLFIHHWHKSEEARIPVFKCPNCGFMG